MSKQIVFGFTLFVTLCFFVYTVIKLMALFRLTKKAFPVRDINKRLVLTIKVAFGQTKIFRKPIVGLMHALVFWGFCVILIGSLEMVVDGLTGSVRALHFFGVVYNIVTASEDIFAGLILILILAFIIRRTFLKIKRFSGPELSHKNHLDATISLLLILFLMVSLLGINMFDIQYSYMADSSLAGIYPLSQLLSPVLKPLGTSQLQFGHEFCWWSHILLIFFFANYLPYSKHFHVFLSIPNVFLSNLNPLGKLNTMEQVTREVKLMMNPQGDFSTPAEGANENLRFGLLDVEDITWKSYLDSLSCTQCGRCTSVCPANMTGKKLSPRKIMMDLRARMKEKGKGLIKNGSTFSDQKALLRDYILPEELWACTTCNACAQECPVNINQPSVIIEMRRYIVMEESGAPGELNSMFSNIENNGAPWQFSQHDRMKWAEGLTMNVK